MAKSTHTKFESKNGDLTVQHHETDSPILPIAQIERLHKLRPDRVDWIFDQTQEEAKYRRKESRRVNTFVFIWSLLGQLFAFLMGLAGIIGGVYVVTKGYEWAGVAISGAAITGLAVVFLTEEDNLSKAQIKRLSPMIGKLTAIFESAEEGGYFCYIQEYPNAISQGETLKDAAFNVMDAFELLIEVEEDK